MAREFSLDDEQRCGDGHYDDDDAVDEDHDNDDERLGVGMGIRLCKTQ